MNPQEIFIVLLRHGIAEPHGTRDDDDARVLTPKGNRRMKQIGRGLARYFPKAEVIHTSPLLRCIETAEWVEKAYGRGVSLRTTDALKPEAGVDAFRALIKETNARHIICVGHEPNLSTTMLAVTGMKAGGEIALKKGGCYGLVMAADGSAHLRWMLSPGVLRKT